MDANIQRRVWLKNTTIFGIMASSLAIVQFAPGGAVERNIAQLQGQEVGGTER